jgi:hypothetical protein
MPQSSLNLNVKHASSANDRDAIALRIRTKTKREPLSDRQLAFAAADDRTAACGLRKYRPSQNI